jgi:dTMP kinase
VPAELKELWIAQYFALVLVDNAQRVVRPALDAGTWVVADRWALDHLANQAALGVPEEAIGPWLDGLPTPDSHLLIDVPTNTALARVNSRTRNPGFGNGSEFLSRTAAGMRAAAAAAGVSTVLDGTRSTEELLTAALAEAAGGVSNAGSGARR